MPEQFLPGCSFRGRQSHKLQFAILTTAALRGGTEPDLLDDAWWQTDDFWQYALYAAVAHIRAAARRAGVPVRQALLTTEHDDVCRPEWRRALDIRVIFVAYQLAELGKQLW